jgi:hypothetical protein
VVSTAGAGENPLQNLKGCRRLRRRGSLYGIENEELRIENFVVYDSRFLPSVEMTGTLPNAKRGGKRGGARVIHTYKPFCRRVFRRSLLLRKRHRHSEGAQRLRNLEQKIALPKKT